MAGMIGGALGGGITGALEGGWKGMLIGALAGGALGALGGWAYGGGHTALLGGMFVAGVGNAAATDSWDSFAGGLAGAITGGGLGKGYISANKEQFANYRAGNGFTKNSFRPEQISEQGRVGTLQEALNVEKNANPNIIYEQKEFPTGRERELFLGKHPVQSGNGRLMSSLGKAVALDKGLPSFSMTQVDYQYQVQQEWANYWLTWKTENTNLILINKTMIHGTEYWKPAYQFTRPVYEPSGMPSSFNYDLFQNK